MLEEPIACTRPRPMLGRLSSRALSSVAWLAAARAAASEMGLPLVKVSSVHWRLLYISRVGRLTYNRND